MLLTMMGGATEAGGGGDLAIQSITNQQFLSANTVHNVTMPGTVDVGDLLMVIISSEAPRTLTTPAGWTLERDDTDSSGSGIRTQTYSKVASGSEGGTSVNFATTTSTILNALVVRFSGVAAASFFESSYALIDNSANIDPPNLTPSWGSANTIWLCLAFIYHNRTVTQYPLPDRNNGYYAAAANCKIIVSSTIKATGTQNPINLKLSGGNTYGQIYTIGLKSA